MVDRDKLIKDHTYVQPHTVWWSLAHREKTLMEWSFYRIHEDKEMYTGREEKRSRWLRRYGTENLSVLIDSTANNNVKMQIETDQMTKQPRGSVCPEHCIFIPMINTFVIVALQYSWPWTQKPKPKPKLV
jgi:hypothetical protein